MLKPLSYAAAKVSRHLPETEIHWIDLQLLFLSKSPFKCLFFFTECSATVTVILKNHTALRGEDVTIPCNFETDETFSKSNATE